MLTFCIFLWLLVAALSGWMAWQLRAMVNRPPTPVTRVECGFDRSGQLEIAERVLQLERRLENLPAPSSVEVPDYGPALKAIHDEIAVLHHVHQVKHKEIVSQIEKLKKPEFALHPGAPAAPEEDGHLLKAEGKPIAISKGGQWQQL